MYKVFIAIILFVCSVMVHSQRTTFAVPHSWNPIVHVSFPVNATLLKSRIHPDFTLDQAHGTAWLFVAASTTKFIYPGYPDQIYNQVQVFTTVSVTRNLTESAGTCVKRGFLILNYYWANELVAAMCNVVTQSALFGCNFIADSSVNVNTAARNISFTAYGVPPPSENGTATTPNTNLLLQFTADITNQQIEMESEDEQDRQDGERERGNRPGTSTPPAEEGCVPTSCRNRGHGHNNNVLSLLLDRYRTTTFVQHGTVINEYPLLNVTWSQVREVRLRSWQSNLFEKFPSANPETNAPPLFAGFDDIPVRQVPQYCERNRGRCFIGIKSANVVN